MNPVKVAVVLPAYEAAATVSDVLNALPREFFQYIILVDDHSRDQTFEIASKDKSVLAYRNEKNLGYGGNIKKCLCIALELGADIIVEIHPDGEYGVGSIGRAIEEVKHGAGLVLGNRFALDGGPLKNGMFFWKYPVIKVLNWACNRALGTRLGDLHQGFRVYSSALLRNIDFIHNSNEYLFSFQIIVQAVFHQFPVREVPQSCRYKGKKRGARLGAAALYSISVFGVIIRFWLAKLRLRLHGWQGNI